MRLLSTPWPRTMTWAVLPALLAALAFVAASCGGEDQSATPAEAPAEEVQAPTGEPIKVMTISPVEYNGPSYQAIFTTAEVYAQWINDRGGINGRPLEVITCDERGDPNQAANCARQAVSEQVVAVVGSFSLVGDSIVPILEEAKIAWFGLISANTALELTSPISFPLGPGVAILAGEAVKAAEVCDRPGLVTIDIPSLPFIVQMIESGLASGGKKLVKTVTVPAAVGGDVSPQVADATTGTDCILGVLSRQNYDQWLPALRQAGATQRILTIDITAEQIAAFPEVMEDAIIVHQTPHPSSPVWADYVEALETYNAPEDEYFSLSGQGSWAGFVAFTKIAEKLETVDNETFLAEANRTTALDTGGLYPTLDLSKEWTGMEGFNRLFNRWVTYRIARDGEIQPLDDEFSDMTNVLTGDS